MAGVGLLRDLEAVRIASFSVTLGPCTSLGAELWASIYALCLAWKMEVRKLVVETDYPNAVRKSNKSKPKTVGTALSSKSAWLC